MSSEVVHRRQWDIDHVLERLRGQNIRVAAESFAPVRWNGEISQRFISPHELLLPDDTTVAGLPLFFEGRLQHFVRQIGVVHVFLEPPAPAEGLANGMVYFRGTTAVILRGPALVKLVYPFHVEKLPADEDNYWRDLRGVRVQFKLPL